MLDSKSPSYVGAPGAWILGGSVFMKTSLGPVMWFIGMKAEG